MEICLMWVRGEAGIQEIAKRTKHGQGTISAVLAEVVGPVAGRHIHASKRARIVADYEAGYTIDVIACRNDVNKRAVRQLTSLLTQTVTGTEDAVAQLEIARAEKWKEAYERIDKQAIKRGEMMNAKMHGRRFDLIVLDILNGASRAQIKWKYRGWGVKDDDVLNWYFRCAEIARKKMGVFNELSRTTRERLAENAARMVGGVPR